MTELLRQADFAVCAEVLTCAEYATILGPCNFAYMYCLYCRLPFDTLCSCGRSQVLRKLGMIDGEGLVTLKGRAACEIDTADELLTTEMMFNGTFNGLDKHQLVSLVSCLVPGEKSQVRCWKSLTGSLTKPV